MTKCTPNQCSKLSNTWCLIYSQVKIGKKLMHLSKIANKK